MALGRRNPELGGREDTVDVIGVNCYPDGQRELVTHKPLPLDDPRRRPFREILNEVWMRYQRPIIIAETSARGDDRPLWLRYVVDECLAALEMGVDLQGICCFPVVDMREWHAGQIGPWGRLGLWDVHEDGAIIHRVPNAANLRALAEAQRRLAASGLLPSPAPTVEPRRLTAPASAQEHAARDAEDLAGDVAAFLRREQDVHRR
jgi:hypothetical protein